MSTTVTTDIRSAIESTNKEFMAAFKRGDTAAIARLYSTRGQLLPPHSDFVSGADAIGAFWQGVLNLGLKEAVLETIEVETAGEIATEVGRYKLLAQEGVPADSGKYLVVWKNEGGSWKIHRDIWSTSQPAAS